VDIEIVVKERSTGSVTLGAGYSSVQGFFFQGRIQEINLLGRGQNLSFETQWGRQDLVRSFSLSFLDPYAFDTKWSAGFDLFMANSPIPDRYLIRRSGFNLRAGYPITDDVQGFVTYKFEHLRVLANYAEDRNALLAANPSLGLPPLRADDTLDKGILSSVVVSVIRDKRNNRFETTGGNYQNVALELAGLGGVKNFAKFTANNRYYNNLIGNFVFKNSTEIGALFNTGGRGIPPSEKFFLGGPWNMRGFDVFSLSPVRTFLDSSTGIATYEKMGGVSQFYSLFELEHPLIREAGIKWVLFYDVGNSFAGFPGIDAEDPDNPYRLRQNYGFGIRWFSPLGPLRFEWGFPVNPGLIRTTGQVEASPSFIFFIGQPF
jgi:outer membrane protein insertion porin family